MTRSFCAFLSLLAFLPSASWGAEGEGNHGGGGLPQFDPSSWPSQIFWLVLFFTVLYVFFSRRALPAIGQTIKNRQDHIKRDLEEAERLSAEAARVKAGLDQSMKESVSKAAETVQQATREGKTRMNVGMSEFRARAEEQILAAEARIAEIKTGLMRDMNGIAAEVAAKAAEKLAGIPADPSQAETVVRILRKKSEAA